MPDFLVSPSFVKGDLEEFQRVAIVLPPVPFPKGGRFIRFFVKALVKQDKPKLDPNHWNRSLTKCLPLIVYMKRFVTQSVSNVILTIK